MNFRETRLVFAGGALSPSPEDVPTPEQTTEKPEAKQRLAALKQKIQEDGVSKQEEEDFYRIQTLETQLAKLDKTMLQEIQNLEEKYGISSGGTVDSLRKNNWFQKGEKKVKEILGKGFDLFNDFIKPIIMSFTGAGLLGGVARKFMLDIERKDYEGTIKKVFPNNQGDLLNSENKETVLGYWSLAMKNAGEGKTAESFEEFLRSKFASSGKPTPSLAMFVNPQANTPENKQEENAKKEYEEIFSTAISDTEMNNLLQMASKGDETTVKTNIEKIASEKLKITDQMEKTKKVTDIMEKLAPDIIKELTKREIMKDLHLSEVEITATAEMKEFKLTNKEGKLGFTVTRENSEWKFTYPAKNGEDAVSATLASGKTLTALFDTMNTATKDTTFDSFFIGEKQNDVIKKIKAELNIDK